MPTENAVYQNFTDLSTNLLRDVYLPGLYDIAFLKKRSWFMNRIPRKSDGVDGATVKIGFRTGRGWSWRPMGEFGYTPTGSPGSFAKQSFTLGCHAATVQATLTEIEATKGEASPIKDLLDDKLREIYETFPYYMRSMLWTPVSGAMGEAASISGTTVTLDNTGLWNDEYAVDRAKLFEPDMYVQVVTAAGVKRGSPVKIVSVDKTLGKIVISSDPGVVHTDLFVIADIAGLENGYNASCPGIYDVIDDDNTFQGVDRSLAANSKFRALVAANGGTARAITRSLLTGFLHDAYDPAQAFTNFRVIERYYDVVVDSKQQYNDIKIVDGYSSIQIQKTLLVEDDDADSDKINVPDFGNMFVAEAPGGIKPLFGEGWKQIAGRPFMEYNVAYWASLVAKDCRYMAVLKDLSLTA